MQFAKLGAIFLKPAKKIELFFTLQNCKCWPYTTSNITVVLVRGISLIDKYFLRFKLRSYESREVKLLLLLFWPEKKSLLSKQDRCLLHDCLRL